MLHSFSELCVDRLGKCLGLEVVEMMVCKFSVFECLVREMDPASTFGSYIPAIARDSDLRKVRSKFREATSTTYFKYVRKGLKNIYYAIHPVSGMKRIAFEMSMVKYINIALGKSENEVIRFAEILAPKVGISYLLRKSEYVPDGKKNHGLLWSKVHFFDRDGNKIIWLLVGKVRAESVVVVIPFSKTDQHGNGRYLTHYRQQTGVCIVTDLENWATFHKVYLRSKETNGVFMKGDIPLISQERLMVVLKTTAKYLGLNEKGVVIHSCRYGGATQLAMAGFPQYVIEVFGGWAPGSRSARVYTQLGGDMGREVSRVMFKEINGAIIDSRARNFFIGDMDQNEKRYDTSTSIKVGRPQ